LISLLIHWIDRSTRAVNSLSLITIALIMGMTVAGIALRLIGTPFSGVTNLSESLLVIAVYLSLAYAQQKKQHVAVELLLSGLNGKARDAVSAFNLIVAWSICSLILYTAWDYAMDAWRVREKMDGAPFYPIYPPKVAIALGISFLWLQLAADFLRQLLMLFRLSQPQDGMGEHGGGEGAQPSSASRTRNPG
jgi:TRAP-type C4-dicarboxylate transport system permease small subunit